MRIRSSRWAPLLGLGFACAVAATAGCAKKAPPPPPPPPAVVVAPVLQRDVPVFAEWIGTTAGDVNADIRPQITGYLLRRVYAEGSLVRRGQLLFEIDPRQFQAQLAQSRANLGQGEASLAKAERDVARFRPLAEQRAVSQQELDNAVAAEQVARANVAALRAAVDQVRLYLEWTKVTSPIAGIAGASVAQVGDLVNPQTALATVSRVDPIRVLFKLSEQEYLRNRRAGAAPPASPQGSEPGSPQGSAPGSPSGSPQGSLTGSAPGSPQPPPPATAAPAQRIDALQLVLADGTAFPHPGRLIFTDREVDVKTGTIGAVGLFPNPSNYLRPGQYAKVRAETGVEHGALLVPQRAVNELQGGNQVAVVGPDDRAEIRNVETGQRIGTLWVIERGLKPGERVVVEGFSRVKAGIQVKPREAPPQAADLSPPPPPSTPPAGR
jgi:membrane fusion protein, multidrug efflux system